MQWITRERPKIDRIACPWLIKKFVDAAAVFIYVPYDQVLAEAAKRQAIPFDIPGVEYTHYKDQCTFDYIIKKHAIKDPAIAILADIVRGADTDQHSLARESAGLWAISAGLSHNITDDMELLSKGMELYDALYSWATHLYQQKHLQNSPFENLLHDVYQKLLVAKAGDKKKVFMKTLKCCSCRYNYVSLHLIMCIENIFKKLPHGHKRNQSSTHHYPSIASLQFKSR